MEISYSKCSSPALVSSDLEDRRILSIAYRSIELVNNESTLSPRTCNTRHQQIFGFYPNESWGVWSAGKKSCLSFPDVINSKNRIDLILDAHPFTEAFKSCSISIKTSSGHRGKAKISGRGSIKIGLKKTLLRRDSRLVVGDFSQIDTPYNFSHNDKLPTISIILLNQEKHHLTCLAAIAAASSAPRVSFEILCVDNGSSSECLQEIRKSDVPMRLIELGENKGFGLANNLAANEARGEYLLFLNNDAFLDQGAVDEMFIAFQRTPDCRIVGSVLRYPDGTMQEAGATLQPDGRPVRHGRNDQKFNLRKLPRFHPVDYVSGASLMIRKSDFLEMGGFDQKYAPAYYEDTDLCMRALLYGQKVYLASRACCYHIENATSSTIEHGAWATSTAEAHRNIFLKDWGGYLATRNPKDLPWHLKNRISAIKK